MWKIYLQLSLEDFTKSWKLTGPQTQSLWQWFTVHLLKCRIITLRPLGSANCFWTPIQQSLRKLLTTKIILSLKSCANENIINILRQQASFLGLKCQQYILTKKTDKLCISFFHELASKINLLFCLLQRWKL